MSTTVQDRLEQIQNLTGQKVEGIMDLAVCVKVTLRRPGTIRKVGSQAQVNVQDDSQGTLIEGAGGHTEAVSLINSRVSTDLSMLRVSKYIFDAPEMKEIEQIDSRIRRYLMTKALPSIFQAGVYLVPIPLVPEVDHILQNYQRNRTALISTLLAAYDRIKLDAKEKLGDLYEERDYPNETVLQAAFSMSFDYISYGVNEKLGQISQELMNREKEKNTKMWSDAGEQIKAALRVEMDELVTHACDRLSGKADGKKKTFKNSMISNMTDFLETFSKRNIVNDVDLATLVNKAKELLKGVDPETVRKNEGLRDSLSAAFAEVKEKLGDMMEVRAARKFRGGDDPVVQVTEALPTEVSEVPFVDVPTGEVDNVADMG